VILKSIVANYSSATQTVTEKILLDYFKYCGTIHQHAIESPYAIFCFSKDYEADTAVFLDNGIVCGGPIEVFRYKEISQRVPENKKAQIEKLAKKFVKNVEKKPLTAESMAPELPKKPVELPKMDQVLNAVVVTNISVKADSDTLADFFSYSGVVVNAEIFKNTLTADSQTGVVYFQDKEATNTALLLSGAFIHERPIEVQPLTPELEKEFKEKKASSSSKSKDNKTNQGNDTTLRSMAAAGYNMGSEVMTKAKTYDEKHWNGSVASTLAAAKEKLNQGAMAVVSGAQSLYDKLNNKKS